MGLNTDTPGYSVGNYRLPPFGEYDLNSRALKVVEFVIAAGTDTAAFVAVAATDSDSYVDVLVDSQETLALWECGYDPIFIKDIQCRIITAFTASVTMTVGDTDVVDGYLVSANIAPTVAQTATLPRPEGTTDGLGIGSTAEIYTNSGGKFYDASSSDDSIDLVIAGADVAAGRAAFYCVYFSADHAIYV